MKKVLFLLFAFVMTSFLSEASAYVCPATDYHLTCPAGQIKQKSMTRGCGFIETCVPQDAKTCPMLYAPVCGLDRAGDLKTYINHCEARTAGADVMYESQCARACPHPYNPVCALSTDGQTQTYRNECEARVNKAQILHTEECRLEILEEAPIEETSNDWPAMPWSRLVPTHQSDRGSMPSLYRNSPYIYETRRSDVFHNALRNRLRQWRGR